MSPFYAVRAGFQPGIYDYPHEARQQTDGYSHADCRRFESYRDAADYLDELVIDPQERYLLVSFAQAGYFKQWSALSAHSNAHLP